MSRQKRPARPPSGLVVTVASDYARSSYFTAAFARTVAQLDPDSAFMYSTGSSVADNCNKAAEALVSDETKLDWLWILGDDHDWDVGLLPRLLGKMWALDLDILVPLCFRRSWPPKFVIYDRKEDGVLKTVRPDTVAEILRSDNPVREILAAGTAGMLVRRRVLEGMQTPWFRNVLIGHDGATISQAGEDLNFCALARACGFRIHADFSLALGHTTLITLAPEMYEGILGMRMMFGPETGPLLPLARPPESKIIAP